jgi:hypothetical protein
MTGVGAEKLTLGPAIREKCFYGSVEERERVADAVSQSQTMYIQEHREGTQDR